MWEYMAASAAAPVIGGLIGQQMAGGKYGQQEAMIGNLMGYLQNIQVPEERQLVLEQLKSQGVLSPEMEQAIIQQDSELQNIALDPSTRNAQMAALQGLQEAGRGEYSIAEKARLNQIMGDINTQTRGQREAEMAALQRRGMGGSGMELAGALSRQQGAAGLANQQGLGVEAMAQQRALEGLVNAGTLGGNIRGQDYEQAANAARAQDLINQFNIANRSGVQQRNVQSRNMAQASNLQNAQDIANQNVGLRNQATQYNLQAPQRTFQNQLMKAQPVTGAMGNMANMYGQQAQATQQMWGGLGQAAGQGFGAYGMYNLGQQNAKPSV